MRIDLHLHTTASDGSDSPEMLVGRTHAEGISIISVTDHDTVTGIAPARRALPDGTVLINGVELSCVTSGEGAFRCHILGYGFDPEAAPMRSAIAEGARKRREKLDARLYYLSAAFGIEFPEDEIAALAACNSVSKIHLARLLIAHGYAADVGSAIDKYLGVRSPDDRIDAKMAIDAIRASGGIAVWAHPIGGEREVRLSEGELFRRARELRDLGIEGLEGYYSRYTAADRAPILSAARELDLLISGGSDYHGMNKTVPLGYLDADGREIDSASITLLERLGI